MVGPVSRGTHEKLVVNWTNYLYSLLSVSSLSSKHLKGRLDPPVSDEKCLFLTKNHHFLLGISFNHLYPPL